MATITPEVYKQMGLNDGEFAKILELMGREPTLTELGMFSVMWSEHCGYKYSRPVLSYFAKYKEAMEGDGLENAGIVELGDGWGITMKVESHNHPSAVEPYQGAATGVGGIIRDILTMGARPVALLNSLRFGPIRDGEADAQVVDRNHYLFERVVAGIAGYGNCVGVPTVAGEVNFHERYSGNPLVNAMCVGMVRLDEITTAAASGIGNPVYYLGSATGRDGIHGATFASDALGEDNEEKRPNVQIGDPFAEKQVIEATLEALQTGAVVAIQDMGAAGLTCSSIEMASKGEVGMRIDLDKVPMREGDMSAYELMLSESQERMFAVVEKGREHEVEQVFQKWGTHAVKVGEVTDTGLVEVVRHGQLEASVNPKHLTDFCPTYRTEPEIPAYHHEAWNWDPASLTPMNAGDALITILRCPNIASKRYVWQQFDQEVITQTALVPGVGDAAVIAPRGTEKGFAVKLDGNSRQVYLHPYVGGQLAVAEAARNVACTGALPVAVTDGLNFGNPQRPHVYWQFDQAVKGIADAAETMKTPVISGNVSFYNESDLGEVLPTPLIGMLGILERADRRIGMVPQSESGVIYLIETPNVDVVQEGLGASEYVAEIEGKLAGIPTAPNMQEERRLCELMADLVHRELLDWAHDLSEGGIAIAAAEIAIVGNCGVSIDVSGESFHFSDRELAKLFGEIPGRILIGCKEPDGSSLRASCEKSGMTCLQVGNWSKSSDNFRITCSGKDVVSMAIQDLARAYEGSIPGLMGS